MSQFEVIHPPRITIRKFVSDDLDRFVELLCNQKVMDNLALTAEMKTRNGAANLLNMTMNSYSSDSPLLAYAIEHKADKAFLGITGLNPLEESMVGDFYALLPPYWHRGFASEVLDYLTKFIFEDTGFKTVLAFITRTNEASIRVAEKNGFTNYGLVENKDFKDLVYMFNVNSGITPVFWQG
ncbi:GNAT family N-acetyltransferase [Pontibacter pamirensis]|uniref:GNAT family N-acetyltransferase n=1 Tax=Pontibacter pamirensis TaxID=2562824 RepID=UPI00138A2FC4|nr:GNAT family N-acetyltransferase [Pontibacter pamirensis]